MTEAVEVAPSSDRVAHPSNQVSAIRSAAKAQRCRADQSRQKVVSPTLVSHFLGSPDHSPILH